MSVMKQATFPALSRPIQVGYAPIPEVAAIGVGTGAYLAERYVPGGIGLW
jgi:hypothetical protein